MGAMASQIGSPTFSPASSEPTAMDVQAMLNMYLSSELAGEKVGDPIWEAIAPMCDSESEFIYEKVDRFAATF